METKFMLEKWDEDSQKLRKEYKDFRDYFDKNRTCRCSIGLCRHLKKATMELGFNQKFAELVNRHKYIGLRTLMSNNPELFEKKENLKNSISK